MTTPTHTIVGITTGLVFLELSKNQGLQSESIVLASAIFANLPDINMLWHRHISTHHRDFTHYPLVMLTLCMFMYFFLYSSDFVQSTYALLLFLGLLSHYILDSFGMTIGIHWLAPLNFAEFSFTKLLPVKYKSIREFFLHFRFHKSFIAEIAVNLICITLIYIIK